jgi:tetratricopeptide (TPR) repeat protein
MRGSHTIYCRAVGVVLLFSFSAGWALSSAPKPIRYWVNKVPTLQNTALQTQEPKPQTNHENGANAREANLGYHAIRVTVLDSENHPIANVGLSLTNPETGEILTGRTEIDGNCEFGSLRDYNYTIEAQLDGWHESKDNGWPKFGERSISNRMMFVKLHLERNGNSSAGKAQDVEFSDAPTFTVAGVTDPTNLGGHGSDVILRTKESAARATASLNKPDIQEEKALVLKSEGDPVGNTAQTHAMRGDIAESEGRPLESVREYQRAAEMEPSEANLFAWGAELLLHRAFDPASEVFTKAHQLFPGSARVLVGLGVTSYTRGRTQQAAQQLAAACDLNSADPMPYLFLGKLQAAEKTEPEGWTERLKRFTEVAPQNALAHYYYAVALTKDVSGAESDEAIEASLLKAIAIDSHLGEAYLQLGVLYAKQKNFAKAISAYQKAIEFTALPDEAHFRLAEVYRLTGDRTKAHDEIALYEQISRQKTQENERERHEVQQFVYTLRGQATSGSSPPSAPPPKPQPRQ